MLTSSVPYKCIDLNYYLCDIFLFAIYYTSILLINNQGYYQNLLDQNFVEPFWRVKIRNKIAIPKTFSDTVPLKCKFRFRWITISVARPASATGTPHSASRRRDSLKVTISHSFFSHSLFYLFLCIFSLHINLTPFVSLDLFQTLLLSLSHFLFFSH